MLVGCSLSAIEDSLPDQRLVYKRQREAAENLEIPPDLMSAGRFDDALDIPGGVEHPATFSEYAGGRAQRQQAAAQGGEVLPSFPNVELKRRGDERWLEVQASPQAVWLRVIAFWREQGVLLVEQNPAVGVMRTDWLDNRAEIRKDFITRMVSKVAEGLYSTSTRDQYTLRIESGLRPSTTEIRLTHRGMAERLVSGGIAGSTERTIWEPSGSDREKEAEMLRRLMVYLGGSPSKAGGGEMPAGQLIGANSRLVNENGVPLIIIPQEFRSAWQMTGAALDRAGFVVEDRDQAQGLYEVRYAGQDAQPEQKPGLLSRLAFWHKPKIDPVKQFQIKVSSNDKESRVIILAPDGKPDVSANGQRILNLIQEQLR
ncbi:outer membrane protein assembly factor BamC [Caldichromatium japonicum]|uniref:Outer membrane protein assembly factor BamC n=2 Tax=Caldichromatium japonicum TaxID=2699430 RepID=A0A6G7VGT0_9GAMM|nr:outer membrane protein assembly factor BamC [Caldichromatium japonicum]